MTERNVKTEAKRRVHNLVQEYITALATGKKDAHDAERVMIAFVAPLLEALGWQQQTIDKAHLILNVDGKTSIVVETRGLNENLDGYSPTREGVRSNAELAISEALQTKADWLLLTNFEETRLYYCHVSKAENGLVMKLKFSEYESRFDELWLLANENLRLNTLTKLKAKITDVRGDDPITTLLRKEGPLTRKQIVEKLGLDWSYKFPLHIRKFGSRKRTFYFVDGQEVQAREAYDRTMEHPLKRHLVSYSEGYFLNLLNLAPSSKLTQNMSAHIRVEGAPRWWERRANNPYTCSACKGVINKGERYIGRKKLIPGMRGPYGHRGSYITDFYHIVCLLRSARDQIVGEIEGARGGINRLEDEITNFKAKIVANKERIDGCKNEKCKTKEEYESARWWRKIDRWLNFQFTSIARGMEISGLNREIVEIDNRKIPERKAEIGTLQEKIEASTVKLREIEGRMQELTNVNTSGG